MAEDMYNMEGAVSRDDNTILLVENLVKAYKTGDGGQQVVLDHVNYKFGAGKLIMIMGRSGSGKTTLLNMLSTLDTFNEGEIYLKENRYSQMSVEEKEKLRRFRMGFVFQSVALIPVMTAYENIDFGLRTAEYKGDRDERIKEVLESVGLSDRGKHFPEELSGGERQRIAIARAYAHRPEILFADEPTGALDTESGIRITELFKHLAHSEGITIIMNTHDLRLAELADDVIKLG